MKKEKKLKLKIEFDLWDELYLTGVVKVDLMDGDNLIDHTYAIISGKSHDVFDHAFETGKAILNNNRPLGVNIMNLESFRELNNLCD